MNSKVKTLTSLAMCVLLGATAALAQDLPPIVPPSIDDWSALLLSLGGLKGASIMFICGLAAQFAQYLLRTGLGEQFAGKWRLIGISATTMIIGVLALNASGLSWLAALTHASTLLAFQVLIHQIMKQFSPDSK